MREVDLLSMAELDASVDGWNRVHGGEEKTQPMANDAFDKAVLKFMKE
jgi:hypothetical protein